MKNDYTSSNAIIQKTKEDFRIDEEGYFHFVILPEDTDNLNYGEYPYDIEVVIFGGQIREVKFINGKFVAVGYSGGMYISEDNGDTWTKIGDGITTSSISFGYTDDGDVLFYCGKFNPSRGEVIRPNTTKESAYTLIMQHILGFN